MPERDLAAPVDACAALLEGEPELHRDFTAIFTDAGARWERLPDDLRLGFADIAWSHLVDLGMVPGPGDRRFIRRIERRCPTCGGAEPERPWMRCEECQGSGWVRLEDRLELPPTLCAALTLASFGADLLVIEATARAATSALWPWRGRRYGLPNPRPPATTIAWRVHEDDSPVKLMRGTEGLCPLLFEALTRIIYERQDYARGRLFSSLYSGYHFHRQTQWSPKPEADRAAAELYDELRASEATVSPFGLHGMMPGTRGNRPFTPVGQRWADLDNPFTHLVALADRGVWVERLEADTIVLALAATR